MLKELKRAAIEITVWTISCATLGILVMLLLSI
mgnify:CR=1 FL=1|jgi:hypothetical protein